MKTLSIYHTSIITVGCCLLFQCDYKPDPNYRFKELSGEQTGITFANNLSHDESFNIVDHLYYYNGGGVGVGDFNNDGLSDIYFVSNEQENSLYLNKGGLKFEDITQQAGVASPGKWKTGVSLVDINADGYLDIYLCRVSKIHDLKGHNELYINNGDLTFTEQSELYGLDFSGFSTQAAFFDFDNDGDLDAYLLNYSVHTPRTYGHTNLRMDIDTLAGDRIYRNDEGYFTDVSAKTGIYQSQVGYGLGIGLTDINQDGFVDIYISNDFNENDYFYVNNQNGTFTESMAAMTTHNSRFSMGNDLADFNNDGFVDIVTLDMLPENEVVRKNSIGDDSFEIYQFKQSSGYMIQNSRNTLQLNRGDGTFSDIAMLAGVHATDWSWSALMADFDNDGLKDLFVSNGILKRPNDLDYMDFTFNEKVRSDSSILDSEYIMEMPDGLVANYFFKNQGDLSFKDYSGIWSKTTSRSTTGAAYADLDNDGDLDMVFNNLDDQAVLLENLTSQDTNCHFLNVKLIGIDKNPFAIGAKLSVYIDGRHQFFEVFPIRGFQSSVDTRTHIGLSTNSSIDSLVIGWPNQTFTTLYDISSDQFLIIDQKENPGRRKNKSYPKNEKIFSKASSDSLGVDFAHKENAFIEFNREALIPHMNSTEGPALAVADVNMDGLDDFFVGGAKHQAGRLYIQTANGFEHKKLTDFQTDKIMEDVDATFFDFDKDQDLDLIVVSGGNEFSGDSPNRIPRLYINDGSGNLSKMTDAFPGVFQNGSCVTVVDFDDDGWDDLFLGSLTVPWNYGLSPKSYLIKNDNGQKFIDVSYLLPDSGRIGMINDAELADLDKDGSPELLLAGEWMNISILKWTGGEYKKSEIEHSSGWWKCIQAVDYDNDGDMDIMVGNLGLNSKLKANKKNPVTLYVNDFDQNGKLDQVLTYYREGQESVFPAKADLTKQLVSIKKKYLSYQEYADASVNDIFGIGLEEAKKLIAVEMRSGVFINSDMEFSFVPFPNEMQFSFLQDFHLFDVNNDGIKDILTAGNFYASSVQEGRYNADKGSLLINRGNGFQLTKNYETGLSIDGEVRKIESLTFKGDKYLLIAINNRPITWLIYDSYSNEGIN